MNKSVAIDLVYTPKISAVQESDSHFLESLKKKPECSPEAGYSVERLSESAPTGTTFELRDQVVDLKNWQEDGKHDEQHDGRHDDDQKWLHDAE